MFSSDLHNTGATCSVSPGSPRHQTGSTAPHGSPWIPRGSPERSDGTQPSHDNVVKESQTSHTWRQSGDEEDTVLCFCLFKMLQWLLPNFTRGLKRSWSNSILRPQATQQLMDGALQPTGWTFFDVSQHLSMCKLLVFGKQMNVFLSEALISFQKELGEGDPSPPLSWLT